MKVDADLVAYLEFAPGNVVNLEEVKCEKRGT
jgi:hypothetical protein